jgi:hypothetical protein
MTATATDGSGLRRALAGLTNPRKRSSGQWYTGTGRAIDDFARGARPRPSDVCRNRLSMVLIIGKLLEACISCH